MATIMDPQLSVEPVDGRPGRRRLLVTYDLEVPDEDVLRSRPFTERVVIRARDLHDAPQRPAALKLVCEQTLPAATVTEHRSIEQEVNRVDLDVEADWWRSGQGGDVEPIAEFADHLVAELVLLVDGDVVASAETPIISGSWGALGRD